MKSVSGSSELNVVEYEGDIVPRTDVDPEFGAIWDDPDEDTSEYARRSSGRTALEAAILDDLPGVEEEPILSWQKDLLIWKNLGIDQLSPDDYRSLPVADYDMWQRVLHNYAKSLMNHAKRIINVEGNLEHDLSLRDQGQYGPQMPKEPQILLEYAARLLEVWRDIQDRLADHTLDKTFTGRKLRNAPDYRTVHVARDDHSKLHLYVTKNQQQIA